MGVAAVAAEGVNENKVISITTDIIMDIMDFFPYIILSFA
jgi:ABC-type methionine transport system permease subunit